MPSWYNAKLKYQTENQNGALQTIAETYLIDAVSYTDAETKVYEIMDGRSEDFVVDSLTKVKIFDIFDEEQKDAYYKIKMHYISIDENSSKEKKINSVMLISADSVQDALDGITKELSNMLVPYVVTDVSLTNILEVVRYEPKKEEELPEGFKPIPGTTMQWKITEKEAPMDGFNSSPVAAGEVFNVELNPEWLHSNDILES